MNIITFILEYKLKSLITRCHKNYKNLKNNYIIL